jgi:hypothetical protein
MGISAILSFFKKIKEVQISRENVSTSIEPTEKEAAFYTGE